MSEVKTVVPVVDVKADGMNVSLEKVTVTIVPGKEDAAILHSSTTKMLTQAFELQKNGENPYDNPSVYQKDALEDAAKLFLNAQCAKAIGRWDSLVTKFSKTQRFLNVGRPEIEKALRDNAKTRWMWENCEKAVVIKNSLK